MSQSKCGYIVPNPRDAGVFEKPPKYGPRCIDDFVSKLLERAGDHSKGLSRQWLVSQPITIGTMCSGSDSPILVAQSICNAMNQGGPHRDCAQAHHAFSVEINEKKQRFIRRMFPELRHMYANTANMSDPAVFDIIMRTKTIPDPVRFLIAGFPCTDVSFLNNTAKLNRGTVKEQNKKTGTCFKGITKYVQLHRETLQLLLLENVLGLCTLGVGKQESDLETCIRVIEQELDFTVVVWRLDPRLFGWPQSRPRLWFVAVNNRLQLCKSTLKQSMNRWMDLFCTGWSLADIDDDVLMHPTDPYITWVHSSCAHARALAKSAQSSMDCPDAKRARSQSQKWLQQHSLHHDWWQSSFSPQALSQHVGLQALTDREADMLSLSGLPVPMPFKLGKPPTLMEVSQSEGRTEPRSDGHSPCVVPRCKIVHCQQARVLTGADCMRLQGICYGGSQYEQFTQLQDDDLLKDLAGNAFNCHCCAAAMLAGIMSIGELTASRALSSSAPLVVDGPRPLSVSEMISQVMDFSSDVDH
jgi:site-specific DNA-cytosine methylase